MGIPERAIELELKHKIWEANGEPTLGAAYEILRDEWRSGDRNRELSLHLMFLSWYLLTEPAHLTGLDEERVSTDELMAIFNEVHEHATPAKNGDAEVLYVVALMADFAPWLLGDDATWEARSREYRILYRALEPNGIDPAVFDGRGAYGKYFARMARIKRDGYDAGIGHLLFDEFESICERP